MRKKFVYCLVLLSITAIGFKLRLVNFASIPLPGQSTDEYSNAWVGLSLLRLGVPVGISGLARIKTYPVYINPDRIYSQTIPGGALPISYPWFDHPPLMGLISGTTAYIYGARDFEDVSTVMIRKPLIILGVINIILLGWLGYLWFGPLTAVLTALLYSTSPLVIVGGRMVQAENGLVSAWLISLLLLALAKKQNRINLVRLAAGFAGLAVLFKLSGAAAIIGGAFLIKNRQHLVEYLAVSTSVALLFVVYGLAIDAGELGAVFLANTGRAYGIGLNALYDLVTSTKVTSTKYLTDGWPLFGWLALAYLAFKKTEKKSRALFVCLISYLAIYLFFGSASYGWYRIPFLPFLFLAAGWFLAEGISGVNPLASLFVFLPLGVTLMKLLDINSSVFLVRLFRFGSFGFLLMILVNLLRPKNRFLAMFTRFALIILVLISIVGNIYFALRLDVPGWYKAD